MKHFACLALVALLAPVAQAWDGDALSKRHPRGPVDGAWQPAPYVGAWFGPTQLEAAVFDDGSLGAQSSDESSTGYGALAGLMLFRYVGLEIGYSDYGEARATAQSNGGASLWNAGPVAMTVDAQAWEMVLLGRFPLTESFAIVPQAGMSRWSTSQTYQGDTQCCGVLPPGAVTRSGEDLLYGLRVEYDWQHLRLMAGYRYSTFDPPLAHENQDLGAYALSLAYRF